MTNYPDLIPQKFMILEDGSNAPLIHQRTIARLTAKLYPYYEAGIIRYEPIPEMMVGEYNSRYDGPPTPGIILYDNATEQSLVIIEVTHTKGQKADLKKVIRLIDEDDYGILEGFVFNYKTRQWLRYRQGDSGVATESSVSDVLQLDLSTCV